MLQKMNDIVRSRIETQLSEMELLMSMYANEGELVFDDASELADLRAALNSDNAMVRVGGLGFTLHLTVMEVLIDSRLYPVRCIGKLSVLFAYRFQSSQVWQNCNAQD